MAASRDSSDNPLIQPNSNSNANAMDIDNSEKTNNANEIVVQKKLKRKRDSIEEICPDKESLGKDCRRELDELFEYYKEFSGYKFNINEPGSSSLNLAVASLLEESSLSYSKLVEEIYEKLKMRDGISLSSVQASVLLVGQRIPYGIANSDVNLLEDESASCLWCWETREMKWLPKSHCGILSIRRIVRMRIHERICALLGMLAALSAPENQKSYKADVLKAFKTLQKKLDAAGIRSLSEQMKQKNEAEMAEKEAKLKEKELLKELVKTKKSAEKEKKRIERELEKEKLQNEKETKRLNEESEKDDRRREKEDADRQKQLKKQQEEAERGQRRREKEEADRQRQLKKQLDEAERDQRRREKEAAEMKRQISMQKQASIMERFLTRNKNADIFASIEKDPSTKSHAHAVSDENDTVVNATTSSMDHVLSQQTSLELEDLRRSYITQWRKLSSKNKFNRWGARHKPKTELIKDIKLQGSFTAEPERASANKGLVRGSDPSVENDILPDDAFDKGLPLSLCLIKKLLQFDKSPRPAYYGTWSKKSAVVGPRHPLRKDPDLDYDDESDEEWEEEDPGESLSDCDKDEEEECIEETIKADDDDDSEDSFVVPDGYLSESEGVHADSSLDFVEDVGKSPLSSEAELPSEEFRTLLRQQNYLDHLTEQALRKTQPLFIYNIMHEKSGKLMAEDMTGTSKIEQICLHALCMRPYAGGLVVDASASDVSSSQEDSSQRETMGTPSTVVTEIDLPELVSTIQSHSQGINRVIDALQQKFPAVSKSQLKSKVRQIASFVDNRWQVTKEVLDSLGLCTPPDTSKRPKGITAFFSKRCLPPAEGSMDNPESSPQSCKHLKGRDIVNACSESLR